jgi:hypothetical protein
MAAKLKYATPMVRRNLFIPTELWDTVTKLSKLEHRPTSELVRDALLAHVKKEIAKRRKKQ